MAESALGGSCVGRLGAAMRPAVAVRSPAKPSRAGVRLMAAARAPTGGDVGRDEARTHAGAALWHAGDWVRNHAPSQINVDELIDAWANIL